MRRLLLRTCLVVPALLLPALSLNPAQAQGAAPTSSLSEQALHAVRAVVEAQLQAFADDDAARAFSYASPSIREQFGDAGTFMAMVRQGYPMVIRPAATAFFQPTLSAPGAAALVLQVVRLRDAAGRHWLATYQLQRQADQGWRINGCVVVADTGQSST